MDVLNKLNIIPVHEKGITGKNVKIAIIDSFASSITNKLTIVKTVSFSKNKNNNTNHHGYNVASIIGSKEFGIAPDSDIYS